MDIPSNFARQLINIITMFSSVVLSLPGTVLLCPFHRGSDAVPVKAEGKKRPSTKPSTNFFFLYESGYRNLG